MAREPEMQSDNQASGFEQATPEQVPGSVTPPGAGPAAGSGGAEPAEAPVADRGLSAEDLVPGLGDAVAAEEIAEIQARLSALEAERDELKDKLMRALAEMENVRRRAERDKRDAEIYGGTKLARDLLSVHDNFGRALASADDALRDTHGSFLEGVELTQKELLNAFAKHKIAPVQPSVGEKFDPNRHQAMFEAPIPGAKPGTVIEVIQSGFVISDRLLRPALVGVAKAAPAPTAPPPPSKDGGSGDEGGGSDAGA